MLAKAILSLATLVLAAGCVSDPQSTGTPAPTTSVGPPVVQPAEPAAAPPFKPRPENFQQNETPRLAALTLRGLERPAPVLPLDPHRLIGMSRAETFAVLGTPSQVREVSPATVWRYAMGGCELDLYFFMDLGSNAFRVLTYDVRTEVSGSAAQQACLGRLRAASRAE